MRTLKTILAVLCLASAVGAQVVPPFGIATTQPAAAYQRGYIDAQRAATRPAMTAAITVTPANPIDKHYAIAPGVAFASFQAALAQAQKDHALWPSFDFAAGQIFSGSWLLPKGFSGITIDGGAAADPKTWAVITSDATGNGQSAIGWLNIANVQINHLIFTAAPSAAQPVPPQAIYCNGAINCSVDHCIFNGFAIGFTSDGGSGLAITNCGFFNQAAPRLGKSQGVFLASNKSPTIAGNIFYHCGWTLADYLVTPNANHAIQLNHGLYINNDSGQTTDPTITGNLFVDCASSGVNSRVGGRYVGNIYRGNGLAADVVIEGAAGEIADSVFFGPILDQPPFYGGGIDGISQQLYVHDCYFFSSAATPLNPAVRADWPASFGALPAGTSATFANLAGFWLRAPTAAATGRTITATNIDIRPPPPGQPMPTLEASLNNCTPAQLETVLRSQVGMNDAPTIDDWAARSWAAMVGH